MKLTEAPFIQPFSEKTRLYEYKWNEYAKGESVNATINITKTPQISAELLVHPDQPKRGKRLFQTQGAVIIEKADKNKLEKERVHRLMDCLNFTVNDAFLFTSEDYNSFRQAKNKGKIIHWLPINTGIPVELRLEDNSIVTGIGEGSLRQLKEGDIIQFERIGFCRLDKKQETLHFWFTHK